MRMPIIFLLACSLLLALEHSPHQGGVAVVELSGFKQKPKLFYRAKEAKVIYQDGVYYGVIGIGLDAKAGSRHILAVNSELKRDYYFDIYEKEYEKEYITLKSNKHVSLSAKNLKRHRGERAKTFKLLNSYTHLHNIELEFIAPVDGRISSPFGKKRYFNSRPRAPHKGIDIAAAEGTPVVASEDGTISIAEEFFFNGNTLYIDHSEGVVSMYCHLHKLFVKSGDRVKKGDIIGSVGKTGRATGAHLHFSIFLNQEAVDPALFIQSYAK